MTDYVANLIGALRKLGYSEVLGMTYLQATALRYKAHADACESLGCSQSLETFETFVAEVVGAPSNAVRDSMLIVEPLAEAPPAHQSYGQYESPVPDGVPITKPQPKQERPGRKRGDTPWNSRFLKEKVAA